MRVPDRASISPKGRARRRRRGAAAAELALVLPLLTFMLLASVDFARFFYHYTTITTCASNGALYASDSTWASQSPYADYKAAAIADGSNLSPPLASSNVTLATGTAWDATLTTSTPYVDVTVTYNMTMLTSYLGFKSKTLSRTVRMPVAPQVPN